LHAQAHFPVVEQQFRSHLNRGEYLGMGQRCTLVVAGSQIKIEAESLAYRKLSAPRLKGAKPKLWSLQIQENPDRPTTLLFEVSDCSKPLQMITMASMTEVQPEDVYTCMK
jgi:hypothetical protein